MPSSVSPKLAVQRKLFEGSSSPATGNASPSDSAPPPEKSTHIEVCARIRPLQITMQSSSSYFGDPSATASSIKKDSSGSPSRKPPVPSRIGKGIVPPSSNKKNNNTAGANNAMPIPEDLFYAWDVLGGDTASQSQKTELVQGRTHAVSTKCVCLYPLFYFLWQIV